MNGSWYSTYLPVKQRWYICSCSQEYLVYIVSFHKTPPRYIPCSWVRKDQYVDAMKLGPLPSSLKIVWCGLQCSAPMAFPAQLFQRPWSTQVAVMTEDARLVALHSLDTVAAIVAPSPARPLRRARICKLDIWSFTICLKSFSRFRKMRRNKMAPGRQITLWTCVSLRSLTTRKSWPCL